MGNNGSIMESVNLSIKNVPEAWVEVLRDRAKRNHRSMQGELMAIIETSLAPRIMEAPAVYRTVKELGLRTSSDSVCMIREDRDAGEGR